MFNTKRINGIKIFGYFIIAFILVGIGFLSAILVQKITRPTESIALNNKQTDRFTEINTSTVKSPENENDDPGKSVSDVALESPASKTPVQSNISTPATDYPDAGIIDADISRDTCEVHKDIITANVNTGKKHVAGAAKEKQKKKDSIASPAQKYKIPSITAETWTKSRDTNVYVIHGNKRIDPYTGRVLETINSANTPSHRKIASAAPPEEKIINNYYYSNNKESEESGKKKSTDDKQAAEEDKEFWYGGYSAISRNPQTTIGEAYRERLKNWPNGDDMSYAGPDNYSYSYSSSSGYTGIGNIYLPTGSGGYGTSGYVKIGNIYLPVNNTYYRR